MSSIAGLGNYIESQLNLAKSNQGGRDIDAMARNLQSSLDKKDKAAIEKTAQEFEAVFINQMLSLMFKDVQPNEVFGGGKTEEIFQSFILEEYANSISQAGGLGIAEHVTKQLLTLQEV